VGVAKRHVRRAAGAQWLSRWRVDFGDLDVPKSFTGSDTLVYLKYFRIDSVGVLDLAPNITICILSFIAAFFTSALESQIDNAIVVLIVAILLSILLAAGVIYLTIRFGKELYELAHAFALEWGITHEEAAEQTEE
jgi:small basic protein